MTAIILWSGREIVQLPCLVAAMKLHGYLKLRPAPATNERPLSRERRQRRESKFFVMVSANVGIAEFLFSLSRDNRCSFCRQIPTQVQNHASFFLRKSITNFPYLHKIAKCRLECKPSSAWRRFYYLVGLIFRISKINRFISVEWNISTIHVIRNTFWCQGFHFWF